MKVSTEELLRRIRERDELKNYTTE